MYKYSEEFKLKVVNHYLESSDGYVKTAQIFNIPSSTTVQEWHRRYEKHGIAGLKCQKRSKKYDGNFKKNVVEYMYNNHLSLTETSMQFNLGHRDLVKKWEKIYREKGPEAFFEKRRNKRKIMNSKPIKKKKSKNYDKDLVTENERLRMENEYLKKLNALVQERIKRENKKK